MKITTVVGKTLFFTSLLVYGLGRQAMAGEPTALELIKEANHYVGDEVKDKVVQIRSEKSVGTLTPNIWYVVFYDADARMKATEVKFGAGRKLDVQRPFRLLERMKPEQIFDLSKLKVDSDEAIKTAVAEPLLKNLSIKATQLWLEPNLKSDQTKPGAVWRVRLWAAKLRHPNDTADIGEVFVSAESGKVVHTDLHINRVD